MSNSYFTPPEPIENLHVLLNRAFSIADMLFTLSANDDLNQFLPHTITSSLDTLCFLIEEAMDVSIDSIPEDKAEVQS